MLITEGGEGLSEMSFDTGYKNMTDRIDNGDLSGEVDLGVRVEGSQIVIGGGFELLSDAVIKEVMEIMKSGPAGLTTSSGEIHINLIGGKDSSSYKIPPVTSISGGIRDPLTRAENPFLVHRIPQNISAVETRDPFPGETHNNPTGVEPRHRDLYLPHPERTGNYLKIPAGTEISEMLNLLPNATKHFDKNQK